MVSIATINTFFHVKKTYCYHSNFICGNVKNQVQTFYNAILDLDQLHIIHGEKGWCVCVWGGGGGGV